jgi:hypothetical protein
MFASQLYILRSNIDDVQGYEGTSAVVGYFILAFENGIGNISNPSVELWTSKKDQSLSASIIIFLVYFYWFLNQFILLIVLLNFVIAFIS